MQIQGPSLFPYANSLADLGTDLWAAVLHTHSHSGNFLSLFLKAAPQTSLFTSLKTVFYGVSHVQGSHSHATQEGAHPQRGKEFSLLVDILLLSIFLTGYSEVLEVLVIRNCPSWVVVAAAAPAAAFKGARL